MKKAKIFHNPSAGKEEYSKKELITIVKSQGFECGYSSTKDKGWKKIRPKTDFFIIAGGDGTVRRVAVKLIDKLDSGGGPPVALLPLGTANNIAKSLGITGHIKEILANLDKDKKKRYDVGRVEGLKKSMLFLESFGYGVFPELMRKMKENTKVEDASPEEELKTAQKLLHKIIEEFPAEMFRIVVDGQEHQGNFILLEVMNISSMGPNLILSPDADPGDGLFEIILIGEAQRSEFADFVSGLAKNEEKQFRPLILKGKDISITSGSKTLHIDDELIKVRKTGKIRIKPDPSMMEFLVL